MYLVERLCQIGWVVNSIDICNLIANILGYLHYLVWNCYSIGSMNGY